MTFPPYMGGKKSKNFPPIRHPSPQLKSDVELLPPNNFTKPKYWGEENSSLKTFPPIKGGNFSRHFIGGKALVDFPCKIGGFDFASPQNLRGNNNISPKNSFGETCFLIPAIIGGINWKQTVQWVGKSYYQPQLICHDLCFSRIWNRSVIIQLARPQAGRFGTLQKHCFWK